MNASTSPSLIKQKPGTLPKYSLLHERMKKLCWKLPASQKKQQAGSKNKLNFKDIVETCYKLK